MFNNTMIYERIVRWLYKNLPEPIENHSKTLKDYYNSKYPSTPIFYSGRVLPNSNKRIKADVRDFFTLNDQTLKDIVKSLSQSNKTDNLRARACLKWVIENVGYISDKKQFNLPEYWEFPFEVLTTMKNDCDGMNLLLANLLLVSGIPNWKVRVNCGYVFEPSKKILGGHAYVTFFDEEKERWVILDACYYPNLLPISERKEYKKEEMYKDIWFSFNDKFSFAKDKADVRKMEGIE